MNSPKINIDIKSDIELRDGIFIHGFPGPGLASSIAVNYIADQLDLPRVGTISSDVFPALAVVRDYVPGHPMRLYGKDGMMLLISEMNPMDALAQLTADNLLNFSRENGIKTIISLEALVQQQVPPNVSQIEGPGGSDPKEPGIYVIASTKSLKKKAEDTGLNLFKEGMVTGVAGLLLSEGERLGVDVLCILTEANPMYPDARAASRLLEVLTRIENLDLDLDKLKKQAAEIEVKVRDSMMQAQKYLDAQQKQQNSPSDRIVPTHMYG